MDAVKRGRHSFMCVIMLFIGQSSQVFIKSEKLIFPLCYDFFCFLFMIHGKHRNAVECREIKSLRVHLLVSFVLPNPITITH